ncbi:MAG: hypothetical protein KIT62_14055 [Cyclobacteriaceae bacterium]|nr:hypothetical protein [Cyclobacteriaceae bacterium]
MESFFVKQAAAKNIADFSLKNKPHAKNSKHECMDSKLLILNEIIIMANPNDYRQELFHPWFNQVKP